MDKIGLHVFLHFHFELCWFKKRRKKEIKIIYLLAFNQPSNILQLKKNIWIPSRRFRSFHGRRFLLMTSSIVITTWKQNMRSNIVQPWNRAQAFAQLLSQLLITTKKFIFPENSRLRKSCVHSRIRMKFGIKVSKNLEINPTRVSL